MVFFEIYNTKRILKFKNIQSYNDYLEKLFDFSKIIPRIDLCITVNIKNNKTLTLSLNENFISNKYIRGRYNPFNSKSFSSINQNFVTSVNLQKTNDTCPKIYPLIYGAFKINFYTPIIKKLFNLNFRQHSLPNYGLMLLAKNCYGYKSSGYKKHKEESLIKNLVS